MKLVEYYEKVIYSFSPDLLRDLKRHWRDYPGSSPDHIISEHYESLPEEFWKRRVFDLECEVARHKQRASYYKTKFENQKNFNDIGNAVLCQTDIRKLIRMRDALSEMLLNKGCDS